MEYLTSLNYITWFIIAAILIGLELLVPGVYIVWFGFAAAAMGIVMWIYPLGWIAQLALFSLFSLAFTLIGIRVYRGRNDSIDSGALNLARGSEYINQEFVLNNDVINGTGRLNIGDSSWSIAGENAPKGTRVKITHVELNTLHFIVIDQPNSDA